MKHLVLNILIFLMLSSAIASIEEKPHTPATPADSALTLNQ